MTALSAPSFAPTPTRKREHVAVKKARALGGPALVRRLGYGRYVVPSASDPALAYVVSGTGPLLSGYRCSCPAGGFGNVCHHVASVHLRRLAENARRDWRKLRGAARQEVA